MCIKIPVKESSFDVTVSHISSLTLSSLSSFIIEFVVYFSEKGKRILFLSLLFTGKRDRYVQKNLGQPYVRLTSTLKSQERKLFLADIFYAIRFI